jgi:ankyrin repeat protein
MIAGRQGYVEIAKLLLGNGAEVNARNREGRTALMEAETAGHTEIVQLLKDTGAVDTINY